MEEPVALLLTDVVDSTAIAARLGNEATASLWTAHDRVARDLLRRWRGREIDKTDGFLLLFREAGDALGYALEYHQAIALLETPLHARAGLHVGPVSLREAPAVDVALGAKPLEVDGLAKSIAARVMSAAQGGQTLMTSQARSALGTIPQRVESHGHWSLKGLRRPVELLEVGNENAPFTPPPDSDKAYRVVREGGLWLPRRELRHSLPAERDAFVGRRMALRELARCFAAGARVVSVLGIGGTGKTRLAIRFGWRWLGDFAGGVWFCDLSTARSLDGLLSAVAQGLDVPLSREDPVVQLGQALAGRGPCLVILDNFEQVARHAEGTLGRWLERAPQARFLVTTREVLGIPGEDTLALSTLAIEDAKALFMSRAEGVRREAPSPEDQAAVGPLVQMLDGLPLAIELAAARVRIMSPRGLLARMSERFKLLSSVGGRSARQSTLRAAFDWSWDLLALSDKMALGQLSVFEGGFTLEAAEAVIDLSAVDDAPWTVDVLQSLVDKSFVRALKGDRFDLLVSVQAYAAEHLRTEGRFTGSGPQAQRGALLRHGLHFASLGRSGAMAGRCADLDNLVAACRCAVLRQDADVAVGALEGAWGALGLRGPYTAAVELAEAVLGLPALDDKAASKVHAVRGDALRASGQPAPAQAHYGHALECARRAGDHIGVSRALLGLSILRSADGRIEEASADGTAALTSAREADDPHSECLAVNNLGNLAWQQGRLEEARSHYVAALELARRAQDRFSECVVRGNLGILLDDIGSTEGLPHFQGALAISRELGDRAREGNALCNLGLRLFLRGDEAQGERTLDAALVTARELGHVLLESVVLCNLALVYEQQARPLQSLEALQASLELCRRGGDHRTEGQVLGYQGRVLAGQSRFEEARASLEAGQVLLRDARDPISTGILLCCLAEAEAMSGDAKSARAALDQAALLASQCAVAPNSELGWALRHAARFVAPASATA
jgi:predicted ATPase/class 3 adenylate cyclase